MFNFSINSIIVDSTFIEFNSHNPFRIIVNSICHLAAGAAGFSSGGAVGAGNLLKSPFLNKSM